MSTTISETLVVVTEIEAELTVVMEIAETLVVVTEIESELEV